MNEMFRAGDERQHLLDDIQTGAFGTMKFKLFSFFDEVNLQTALNTWLEKNGHLVVSTYFSTATETEVGDGGVVKQFTKYSVAIFYREVYELSEEEHQFQVGDYAQVITPESAYEGMIGEVKSVHPITLLITGSDDVFDIGPFDASELVHADEPDEDESDEDRLERQAQAHLESAALHRDDPIF